MRQAITTKYVGGMIPEFGVINTGNRGTYPNIVHDAAAPYAVVEFSGRHGIIRSVRGRYETMKQAKRSASRHKSLARRGD